MVTPVASTGQALPVLALESLDTLANSSASCKYTIKDHKNGILSVFMGK